MSIRVSCPLCDDPVDTDGGVCTSCGSPLPDDLSEYVAELIDEGVVKETE
jgi:hypothetical protein